MSDVARALTKKEVAAARHDGERSPEWPRVRRAFLAEHPACAACGSSHDKMDVHHKRPFHLFPELELEETNLITLCMHPSHICHLIFGHLLNYSSYNPDVEADAAAYLAKLKARPHG